MYIIGQHIDRTLFVLLYIFQSIENVQKDCINKISIKCLLGNPFLLNVNFMVEIFSSSIIYVAYTVKLLSMGIGCNCVFLRIYISKALKECK